MSDANELRKQSVGEGVVLGLVMGGLLGLTGWLLGEGSFWSGVLFNGFFGALSGGIVGKLFVGIFRKHPVGGGVLVGVLTMATYAVLVVFMLSAHGEQVDFRGGVVGMVPYLILGAIVGAAGGAVLKKVQ